MMPLPEELSAVAAASLAAGAWQAAVLVASALLRDWGDYFFQANLIWFKIAFMALIFGLLQGIGTGLWVSIGTPGPVGSALAGAGVALAVIAASLAFHKATIGSPFSTSMQRETRKYTVVWIGLTVLGGIVAGLAAHRAL